MNFVQQYAGAFIILSVPLVSIIILIIFFLNYGAIQRYLKDPDKLKIKKNMAMAYWLLATLFFGGLGGSKIIPVMIELYTLSKSSQIIQAVVIETHPEMHFTCKYRFTLAGNSYEETGGDCGNALIGEHITVYYSPKNPDKSVNKNPWSLFMNDLITFVLAVTIFPLLAAFVAYQRHGEN
jgi:hypothetical protein